MVVEILVGGSGQKCRNSVFSPERVLGAMFSEKILNFAENQESL